jgi:hypothetical protein
LYEVASGHSDAELPSTITSKQEHCLRSVRLARATPGFKATGFHLQQVARCGEPNGICEGAGSCQVVVCARGRRGSVVCVRWCCEVRTRVSFWVGQLGCQASVRPVRVHGAVGPRPARTQSVRRRRHRGGSHAVCECAWGRVRAVHAAAGCWRQRISPSRRP